MSTNNTDTFLAWLKDAYALENKLVSELKVHAAEAKDLPDVQSKILQHAAETERHASTVRSIIEELGGEISVVKDMMGHATSAAQQLVAGFVSDTAVKNALTEFTMEATEISSYISLIATAEQLHLVGVVERLRGILREEEAMMEYLRAEIPRITVAYLRKEAASAA